MARQTHARDDLIAEATALSPRAEFACPGEADPIVLGFRGDAGSIYFGEDPAYHFTSSGALRRAFVGGRILKADAGRLVGLVRENRPSETALHRRELNEAASQALLAEAASRIGHFAAAIRSGDAQLLRQAPAEADAIAKIAAWLNALTLPPPIADRPNVG